MYEPPKHITTFFIAGFQHYDGAFVLEKLQVGTKLDLVPQPDNPYDPYAIELRFEDAKLGYVPKGTNELISLLLFFGHDDVFETRVVQVNKDKDPWKQVRVGIYITDKR